MLAVWLDLRDDGTIVPRTPFDQRELRQLDPGKYLARLFQPRNKKLDNKFHATLREAFHQQDRFDSYDRFFAYVAVRAGRCKVWEFPSGSIDAQSVRMLATVASHTFAEPMEDGIGVRISAPLSTKAEEMDGAEFAEFFPRAMDVLAVDFGLDVEALGREGTGL